MWVCVYKDSTDLYPEEEETWYSDNLVDLWFPQEVVVAWYEENKLECDEESADALRKPITECTFDDWYYEVYTADDTDGLYWFAVNRGYTIEKE